MPSRRDAIRMTPQEVRAYLAQARRIVLVTIGADGMPHPVPMSRAVPTGRRGVHEARVSEAPPAPRTWPVGRAARRTDSPKSETSHH